MGSAREERNAGTELLDEIDALLAQLRVTEIPSGRHLEVCKLLTELRAALWSKVQPPHVEST